MLDSMLDKKMLVPRENEGKLSLAGQEGVKLKRVLGALRNLWRSNKTNGQDEKITHLKSFLERSPTKAPDSGDEAALPDGPAENDGWASVAKPDSEPSDSESLDGEPIDDGDEIVGRGPSRGQDDDQLVEREPSCGHHSENDDESDGSESESNAVLQTGGDSPTLRLGESPKSDKSGVSATSVDSSCSSSHRDSQVSSGWMGKAINHYSRQEEKENRLHQLVQSVHNDLESQVMSKLEEAEWTSYQEWCLETLRCFGDCVYPKLAKLDFFKTWCSNRKAQDTQFQR